MKIAVVEAIKLTSVLIYRELERTKDQKIKVYISLQIDGKLHIWDELTL